MLKLDRKLEKLASRPLSENKCMHKNSICKRQACGDDSIFSFTCNSTFKSKEKRRSIHSLYLCEEKLHKSWVGTALLEELVNEMKRPNTLFEWRLCKMIFTSAKERYGFTQVTYQNQRLHRNRRQYKRESHISLAKSKCRKGLYTPCSLPIKIREYGVKIFFNSGRHMCKYMNENIKAKIREVNPTIEIIEHNL